MWLTDNIERRVKRAVVPITTVSGEVKGTGFLVSAHGLVMTCWHVIQSIGEENIFVRYADESIPAKLLDEWSISDPLVDFALLSINHDTPDYLGLQGTYSIGQLAHAFGFQYGGIFDGYPIVGKISGSTGKQNWLVLSGADIVRDGGLSGAPVIAITSGRVIAVMKCTFDEKERSWVGFAVPIPTILRESSTLLEHVDYLGKMSSASGKEIYLQGLVREFDAWETRYFPLEVAFNIELCELQTEDIAMMSHSPQKRSKAIDAIRIHHRLAIIGDAGAGKTTILKRTAWEIAKEGLQADNANSPIPIYVALNQFDDTPSSGAHGILELARATFTALLGESNLEADETFEQLLKARRILLLLDGINELSEDLITKCENNIKNLMRTFPDLWIVVTSRKSNYDPRRLNLPTFEVLSLVPQQIKEFLIKYLDEKTAVKFLDELHPALRSLIRNPLALFAVARVYSRQKEMPKNLGSLLQTFVIERLRDNPYVQNQFTIDLKHQIAAKLGLDVQVKSQSFDWRFAIQCIGDEIDSLGIQANPEDIVAELCQNQILVHVEYRRLRFWHQVIQEYFAASRLVSDWRRMSAMTQPSFLPDNDPRHLRVMRNFIKTHILKKEWREVFTILVGLLDDKEASKLIREMVLSRDVTLSAELLRQTSRDPSLELELIRKLKAQISLARLWGYFTIVLFSGFLLLTSIYAATRFFFAGAGPLTWMFQVPSQLYYAWYDFVADNLQLTYQYPRAIALGTVVLTTLTVVSLVRFVIYKAVVKFEIWINGRFLEPTLFACVAFETESTNMFLIETYDRIRNDWFIIDEFRNSVRLLVSEKLSREEFQNERESSSYDSLDSLRLFVLKQDLTSENARILLDHLESDKVTNMTLALQALDEFAQSSVIDHTRFVSIVARIASDKNRSYSIRRTAYHLIENHDVTFTRPRLTARDLYGMMRGSTDWLEEMIVQILLLGSLYLITPLGVFFFWPDLSSSLLVYTAIAWAIFLPAIVLFRSDNSIILSPRSWIQRLGIVCFTLAEAPYSLTNAVRQLLLQQGLGGKIKVSCSLMFGIFFYIYIGAYLFNRFPEMLLLNIGWVIVNLCSLSFVTIRSAPELWSSRIAEIVILIILFPLGILSGIPQYVASYWSRPGYLWIQRRFLIRDEGE